MIRVNVRVATDKVGSECTDTLEFPDGTLLTEIEAECKDWAMERVEWTFDVIEGEPRVAAAG